MAAKKRKPGRPKSAARRESIVALRGLPEFKTWLDEFAVHSNLSVADTITQALICYAEQRGFRLPPKR